MKEETKAAASIFYFALFHENGNHALTRITELSNSQDIKDFELILEESLNYIGRIDDENSVTFFSYKKENLQLFMDGIRFVISMSQPAAALTQGSATASEKTKQKEE